MGIFSTDYEKEAEELWKEVEKNLRPKDGLRHVLTMDGVGEREKPSIKNNRCFDIYNMKINSIVEKMQKMRI